MKSLLLVSSYLSAFIIGYAIIEMAIPLLKHRKLFWLKISLAAGTGFAIISILYFLFSLFNSSRDPQYFLIEGLLFLAATAIILTVFKKPDKWKTISINLFSMSWSAILCGLLFMLTMLLSMHRFARYSLTNPHGEWDGFAIWNMHARFMFRGGTEWQNYLTNLISWTHPDYPLLLPSVISRTWSFVNSESTLIPAITAAVFTYSTIFLLFSGIKILRDPVQAFISAIVLTGTISFTAAGVSQYADVPLGFYFLGAVLLMYLYDTGFIEDQKVMILSGMLMGFAAWTKNEGASFVLAILVARLLIVLLNRNNWRKEVGSAIAVFYGLIPILVVVLYFKLFMTPPNDIFGNQQDALMVRLTNFSRLIDIFRMYLPFLAEYGKGMLPILPVLLLYIMIFGVHIPVQERKGLLNLLLILVLLYAQYTLIYLISPHPLEYHLVHSFDRLITQGYPMILLFCFLIVKSPKQVFGEYRIS